MIVPVMAISNLVLTQQIYSEETNGAHAHSRDRVLLSIEDGNGSENVTQKVNLHCFKLHRSYCNSFNLSNVGDFFRSLIPKDCI